MPVREVIQGLFRTTCPLATLPEDGAEEPAPAKVSSSLVRTSRRGVAAIAARRGQCCCRALACNRCCRVHQLRQTAEKNALGCFHTHTGGSGRD